jgi:hypothetical protein
VRGRKLLKSRSVQSWHTRHQFYRDEEGVGEQIPDFMRPNTGCSETRLSTQRSQASRVSQLLLRMQTEETDYQNVFLQPEVRSRSTVALLGCGCNSFVALRAAVLGTHCDISQQNVV